MRSLEAEHAGQDLRGFRGGLPDDHLKDLVVDEIGAGRDMVVKGRRVTNFGSDSFLGLDRDPR